MSNLINELKKMSREEIDRYERELRELPFIVLDGFIKNKTDYKMISDVQLPYNEGKYRIFKDYSSMWNKFVIVTIHEGEFYLMVCGKKDKNYGLVHPQTLMEIIKKELN